MNNNKLNERIERAVDIEIARRLSPRAIEAVTKFSALIEVMFAHWQEYYLEVRKMRIDITDIQEHFTPEEIQNLSKVKKNHIELYAYKYVAERDKGFKEFDRVIQEQFKHIESLDEKRQEELLKTSEIELNKIRKKSA